MSIFTGTDIYMNENDCRTAGADFIAPNGVIGGSDEYQIAGCRCCDIVFFKNVIVGDGKRDNVPGIGSAKRHIIIRKVIILSCSDSNRIVRSCRKFIGIKSIKPGISRYHDEYC